MKISVNINYNERRKKYLNQCIHKFNQRIANQCISTTTQSIYHKTYRYTSMRLVFFQPDSIQMLCFLIYMLAPLNVKKLLILNVMSIENNLVSHNIKITRNKVGYTYTIKQR